MAALLSMAAVFLPPLSYLASGVIALTTLKMGPKEGIRVLLASVVTFGLLAALMLGQIWIAGVALLSAWLPVFLVTLALGYSRSLSLAILASTAVGGLVIIAMYVLVPDQVSFWTDLLSPLLERLSQQENWPYSEADTLSVTYMMTGLLAAGVSFNALVGVLIGRAWQAQLFNPGAFGQEFRQLRIGKPLALVAAGVITLAVAGVGTTLPLVVDVLPVLILALTIQGVAIVHALVKARGKGVTWLVVMYVLLVLLSVQMTMILTSLGVLDQWFNFRKRSRVE
jgi:hypothetical protein